VQRRNLGSSIHLARSNRPLRLALSAVAAVAVLLATAVGASAEPSPQDKYAQREAILEQMRSLDEQVGAAAERWNGANLRLTSITGELANTRRDLGRARVLYRVSQARMAKRLRALYVNGDTGSTLEVILGAKSLDEIILGLEAIERVSAQDARIARDAESLRNRVARRQRELTQSQREQAVVVDQLAAERGAIEAQLAERQRLYESVSAEIAQLEAAERARQAKLERQAREALERQREQARLEAERAAATPTAPASAPESLPTPTVDEPTYTAPPPDGSKASQVVAIAMQYLGIPYQWGGASPSTGFDCSGLTTYVFAQVGISLPHHAASQYQLGTPVSRDQLQPGDLVFFRGLGHMGMYIGDGNFIHAPRTGDVVKISSLSEPYYVAGWVGAKRIL
jgi:cell wall-associated NlpC family hydrolase